VAPPKTVFVWKRFFYIVIGIKIKMKNLSKILDKRLDMVYNNISYRRRKVY